MEAQVLDLEKVITRFWPMALGIQLENFHEVDEAAILQLNDPQSAGRIAGIRHWLGVHYAVFQGLTNAQRDNVTAAIVGWADAHRPNPAPLAPAALADAHEGLAAACVQGLGIQRDVSSLASKALWLCYPENVPMLDRNARNALYVLSKLMDDFPQAPAEATGYRAFVHVWLGLYNQYKTTIEPLEIAGYPYRVRVFDKILWLLGDPRYGMRP